MRHQNTQDSHKHVKTSIYERAYETPKYGILINTLKQAYMSLLMRHQNAQDSHKHAKTCIYERAYETPKLTQDSHQHTIYVWQSRGVYGC